MKKFLILKLLLLTILSYSQDLQNSNWVYSNTGGLNFTNATPVQLNVTGAPSDYNSAPYLEGCASVSDQNGNLLMFSNGVNVWCRNNLNNFVTVNGQLKGDPSSVQNVIFIPRPGYPSRYYIVTINGNTDYLNNGSGFKGLFYQEIDTASQIMIGQSTALSFLDPVSNGNVIVNEQFGNISESITSTKHSNGRDFWLLAHVQNNNGGRLLSFRVTCSGFQTIGITGPPNILTILNGKATAIKVSPNSQRFALFSENSVNYGSFNNTNGSFGLPNVISDVASYNGEFSPNSNVLFYSTISHVKARNLTSNQLDVNVAPINGFYGIQIARDNKIYFVGSVKSVSNRIRVIGSPDQFNAFNVASTAFYHPFIGFPQTVHWNNDQNIIANNDSYTFNFCSNVSANSQITSLGAVFQNDTYNNALITSSTGYVFNTVSATSSGITLNSNGTISVSAGTPAGVYTLSYNVCTSQSCPQCSNNAFVTINVVNTTAVNSVFNIPSNPICYEGEVPELPTVSNNGISGTWSPSVIDNTESGTYVFTPSAGQCANQYSVSITILPTYNLTILDQYVDGTQSGSNIVGLYVNGNFPSGTTYEWIVYREDSSVDIYPPTTQALRYVAASVSNRITYVEVIAHYGNCSRVFASTFHCAIPNSDQYGQAFPDCSGRMGFREKENTLKNDLIKIYPNPVSSEINFEGLNSLNYTISIYDSFGKLVLKNEKIKEKINFENVNKGFYFYEISEGDLIIQRGKLIKD